MNLAELLFWVFGGLALLSALGIVITRNVIHGALLLVLTLLSLAAIFILFGAEFLAVVQILVYAGGIVVLMVFGIMLTKRGDDQEIRSGSRLVIPTLIVGGVGLYFLLQVLTGLSLDSPEATVAQTQVEQVGVQLMTANLVAFELIAYLLLVVLVGAAYLAKRKAKA